MKRTKEFIKRNIAGEIVLVPSGQTAREFNGMVTLTETGEFIWEHIEEAESFNHLAYIIHSGFISGYQNRYGDNLKPPTNVYHRMTA